VKRDKGGPDRDRGYWDPSPSAIGRIEARVVDIEAEPVLGPPPTRRQRLDRAIWRHRTPLGVGLGATVILVAVVVTGPGTHSGRTASPSPTSGQVAEATPSQSEQPSDSGLPSPTTTYWPSLTTTPWPTPGYTTPPDWTPTPPAPPVSKGWPVTLDEAPDAMVVGPDGTVYLTGSPALSSTGHPRTGWLQLPDGDYQTPVAFASDGTIYVTDSSNTSLYAFAANGKMRPGWPVSVGTDDMFEAGPAGSLYVFTSVSDSPGVKVLSLAGKTMATWDVSSGGLNDCGAVIRQDGTLFYGSSAGGGEDCSVDVYSAAGVHLSKTPDRGWDSLTMAPDGTVVAVGYDLEPYASSVVARTRLAVIGTDGRPMAGWPVALEGAVSPPSFGPDGTMYVAQAGLGTSPSKVVAFDVSGVVKAGWSVVLPAGLGPFSDQGTPLAPQIGGDGTVYVAATNTAWTGSVFAFDPAGAVLPGWPYQLPQAFADLGGGGSLDSAMNPGPQFVGSASGGGLLYLVLDGRMVALGHDGTMAPGWPYVLAGATSSGESWTDFVALPDGSVVATTEADGPDGAVKIAVLRLTPKGKLAN
jgi:hypothetical protein